MMKVEWNTPDQEYHSCVLDEDEAWALYYSLEDEGLPVLIESMSRLECEEYFKKQQEA